MRRSLFVLAAAAVLIAGPVSAHDLWITLSSGAVVPRVHLHYGHPGDLQMPQPEKLVEMTLTDGRGTRSIAPNFAASPTAPVLVSEPIPGIDSALVAARYDNGFWVKMPDGGYRNTTRRFAPGAAAAVASVKFAKFVGGAGAPWAEPVGHELELVPLDDPAAVKAGGSLRVKVLFRGSPVAGAKVARSDGETAVAQDRPESFTADASGIATVPIETAGGAVLSVARRVSPSSLPDLAEADTFSATLAFAAKTPETN